MKKQHSLNCSKPWSCALGGAVLCVPSQRCWREPPPQSVCTAQCWAGMLLSVLATAPPAPFMAGPAHSENSVCGFAPVCDHDLPWKSPQRSTLPLFSHAASAFDPFAAGTGFMSLLVYSSHKMFLCVLQSLLSDDTLKTVKQDTPWACSAHQLLSSLKGMLHSSEVYICSCARHTNASAEITQSLTDVVHTAFY